MANYSKQEKIAYLKYVEIQKKYFADVQEYQKAKQKKVFYNFNLLYLLKQTVRIKPL